MNPSDPKVATSPWPAISRRGLFGLATGLGVAALAGCAELDAITEVASGGGSGGQRARAYCVPRGATIRRERVGGAVLAYEENDRAQAFNIDEPFAAQLDEWMTFFNDNSGLATIDRIRTFGTWIDGSGDCSSWHHSGRAFDFARLVGSDGNEVVSCRNDQWRDRAHAAEQRRRYWALAASLHRNFSFVVTYAYNGAHANHIHVDNGASGNELATFAGRSRTQVQAAQAICTHLFDSPVEVTGSWDEPTRQATAAVLSDLGIGGSLTDDGAWTGFMGAATGRAA